MNPSKLVLPLALLSAIAVGALGFGWWRDRVRVHQLTLATASASGEYYAFGKALAEVVSTRNDDIEIEVKVTRGSIDNLEQLEAGQAQLALVQSDSPGTPSTRSIAMLFPEIAHVVVAAESGIERFSDLQTRRVALMPEGSGSYKLFWAIAEHYELSPQRLNFVDVPSAEAYAAFRTGEIDAFFQVMALGNPELAALLESRRARLLPIDQVTALQLTHPYFESATIPAGTYDGARPMPPQDVSAVGVRAVLICHEAVPADVAYRITETLYEYRSELVARYPRAATIVLPESGENLGFPTHPGARSFYTQDRPSFLVQYAEPMGFLLSISVLVLSGLWELRAWLVGRQKNRADVYNMQIVELLDRIHASWDLEELTALRRELLAIFRKVVVDLDRDRISPESFQSFTVPWEVAITSLRHKELILLAKQ